MFRSLFARRLIMGATVVMLLLCQTAAVTFAYAAPTSAAPVHAAAPVQAAADTAPCHHDISESDNNAPAHGCQDRCPSRAAAFETTKIDIPAATITALPAYAYAFATPRAGATVAARREPVLARAAPPPLRLVYCRLLN